MRGEFGVGEGRGYSKVESKMWEKLTVSENVVKDDPVWGSRAELWWAE